MSDLYPFKNNFLVLNGLQYHYLDEGQGDPVVMVHGNPSWSFYYRNLAKTLRDRYRVIVPDHIGCGLSHKPGDEDYSYTLQQRVDDLEEREAVEVGIPRVNLPHTVLAEENCSMRVVSNVPTKVR